jgi:hypothetical protein
LILPGYWIMGLIPSKREAVQRLGLVTLKRMIAALVEAVENPAQGIKIMEVPDIRRCNLNRLGTPPNKLRGAANGAPTVDRQDAG